MNLLQKLHTFRFPKQTLPDDILTVVLMYASDEKPQNFALVNKQFCFATVRAWSTILVDLKKKRQIEPFIPRTLQLNSTPSSQINYQVVQAVHKIAQINRVIVQFHGVEDRAVLILFDQIARKLSSKSIIVPRFEGSSRYQVDQIRFWMKQNLHLLEHVTCLRFDGCKLLVFPEEIFLLKNLRSLWMRNNSIQEIPAGIKELRNLRYLDLEDNRLTSLPEEMEYLTDLRDLNLSDNSFEVFPKVVYRLRSLEYLDISDNKIKFINSEIGGITKLISLSLAYNKLNELPQEICNLTSLEALNISHNYLSYLPQNFGNFRVLKKINVCHNRIQIVPFSFLELCSLQEIDFSVNLLSVFPDELGQIMTLNKVDLSFNPIRNWGYQIGNLSPHFLSPHIYLRDDVDIYD